MTGGGVGDDSKRKIVPWLRFLGYASFGYASFDFASFGYAQDRQGRQGRQRRGLESEADGPEGPGWIYPKLTC